MLGSVKSWWAGADKNDSLAGQEEKVPGPDDANVVDSEVHGEIEERPTSPDKGEEQPSKIATEEDPKNAVNTAKEWGSYLFSVSKKATQVAAKHVTTTAKQLKDQCDDNTVLEKTPVLGEFNKEQAAFIASQRSRSQKAAAALPPWVGYNPTEEAQLRTQILTLAQDERNFVRNPPPGANFTCDVEAVFPVAMAILAEDPGLGEMRFKLVPKRVKEDVFWRNYFYRISLIKQSAQLTSLGTTLNKDPDTNQKSNDVTSAVGKTGDTSTESYDRLSDFDENKGQVNRKHLFSDSEPTEEADFVSDSGHEDSRGQLSEEERAALGVKQEAGNPASGGTMEDWEEELQRELNEFELVSDGTTPADDSAEVPASSPDDLIQDEELEREIMAQLEQEEEK